MLKLGATLALAAAVALPAQAQGNPGTTPYWVHVGAAAVRFNSSASVNVPAFGGVVPGQSAQASNDTTLGIELGYALAPNWIASMTVGIPPVTRLTGNGGPLNGAVLGDVKYGPAVLSAHHHWNAGAVRPYLGGGLTYVLALESRDATLTGLNVKNALGTALQAGVDVPISGNWGLFIDVKKLFVKAKASFEGPAPGTATVKLDPVIVHIGMGLRF